MTYEEYLQLLVQLSREALEGWEVTLGCGDASLDFDAVRSRMEEDGAFAEGVRLSMLDARELLEVHRLLPPEERLIVVAHALLGMEKTRLFLSLLSGTLSAEAGAELLGLAVHAEEVQGPANLQVRPPEISDLDHRALKQLADEAAGNWKELYLSLQHTFSVGWGWQVAEEEEASTLQDLLKVLKDMRGKLITLKMLTG